MFDEPLISIVTVVFNNVDNIEKTLQSVINQTYKNIEYIVIDGSSTDGTVDIIKKYQNELSTWISEPDGGIYDAMNKGIDIASGEWINFMNSGDMFFDEKVLEKIFYDNQFKQEDVIYGNVKVVYPNKTKIVKAGSIKKLWKGSQFSHQSAFVSSRLQKKHKFNLSNYIGADFEFFYKAYKNNKQFKYVDVIVSSVSSGGVSDMKRIDSIVGWWNVVDKTRNTNYYYLRLIVTEIVKEKIKKFIGK